MVWLGLEAEEYDRLYTDKELTRRMFKFFSPYKNKMILVGSTLVLSSLAGGIFPYITSLIIRTLGSAAGNVASSILFVIAAMFGLNVISWGLGVITNVISARIIGNVVMDLQTRANRSVLDQDMSFFDKHSTGKLVSRINSDGETFGQMAYLLVEAMASLLVFVIVMIPVFVINLKLSIIFSLMIPLVFIVTLRFRKVARKRTLMGQRALSNTNSFVQESMTGIQIAKTFRRENKLYHKFREVNQQSFEVNFKRAWTMNLIFPTMRFVQAFMVAIIIYFGGRLIGYGGFLAPELTTSELVLYIQSVYALFIPLFVISSFWPQFQSGLAAAERIFALIDSPSQVVQTGDHIFDKIQGKIEFRDLVFEYSPGKPVFDHFSLTIQPGESIAIVGHTGAGKSSLARLLMRLYEFQEGDIFVDGVNLRSVNLEEYRKKIGMISQTPFLWAKTVEENVSYGSEGATREEVLWALEQAGGADWINDLDEGLQTNVNERGKLLSMGQRQLVAFARILLQDPSILILDEATASVDPFTETRIQEALEKLISHRTSIIIAHRLWTVQQVDRIIVLDQGRIIEQGNHAQLMAEGGYYAQLYNTYFRHQSYEFVETVKAK